MRKVLIVTHEFPGMGGSRLLKFAQHLPRLGYEPVILTVKAGKTNGAAGPHHDIKVFRTPCVRKSPFRVFSKLFGSWSTTVYFESLFFIPDLYITWLPSALIKGYHLIKEENIDVILTSSPPESLHLIGLLLKKLTGVKWIADFQDLWTTKKIVYRPPTHIHDLIVKRLERTIYAGCDHLIANTMGNKRFYRELFGIDEKRVTVIPCGYDTNEEALNHSRPHIKRPSDTFILGYMGYFDKDGFPWQEFLLSFKDLIDSRRIDGIEFRICGHMSHQARRFIEKNDLSGHVRHYGVLPHEKAYKLISESDLLVLLLYETSYSKAIVPHKLYYYLAMSKPVLALVEEGGEVEDIMRRTGAGKTVSATKPDAVRQALNEYYDQWKERGQISYSADREIVAGYEYGNLTRTLKEAMDKVLGIDVEIFRVKNEQGSGRKNDKPYLYLHREHQV